jgi:hypothetical protein
MSYSLGHSEKQKCQRDGNSREQKVLDFDLRDAKPTKQK